jgi:hypothetical protein
MQWSPLQKLGTIYIKAEFIDPKIFVVEPNQKGKRGGDEDRLCTCVHTIFFFRSHQFRLYGERRTANGLGWDIGGDTQKREKNIK